MANPSSLCRRSKKLSLLTNISFLFLLSLLAKSYLSSSNLREYLDHDPLGPSIFNHPRVLMDISVDSCAGMHEYTDAESKCLYIKTHASCKPKGYINYVQILYCNVDQSPFLGYMLCLLWLLILFYLLGNTASTYFCSSLESLSKVLKLSPVIAGITLLALGNGAPDVFASVVSFTKSSNGELGLNSILGGAFFVSSTVIGIISILMSPISPNQAAVVDKASFVRDVLFFLFSLSVLLVIIVIGRINLWCAICFLSIYLVYVCVVCLTLFLHGSISEEQFAVVSPSSSKNFSLSHRDVEDARIPMLGYADDEKPVMEEKTEVDQDQVQNSRPSNFDLLNGTSLSMLLFILELPLNLPRRLTIPVISEDRWSKPYAVISVTLAPVLLAALLNTQRENVDSETRLVTYMTASLIGIFLGNMAYVSTKRSNPPIRCLLPWLAGGFVMSVTWTYIIAEELVSLLISLGYMVGINPSILGVTILAWGNSLGDLIANGAMAMSGGTEGVQIAIAGCYAGPMFNTLVGIGLPLVLSSWSKYPDTYVIPSDPSLYETLGFLIGGLLWALVMLPRKNMELDRSLGVGLLAIYTCFLFLKITRAIGLLKT